jgi:hypothetical protein
MISSHTSRPRKLLVSFHYSVSYSIVEEIYVLIQAALESRGQNSRARDAEIRLLSGLFPRVDDGKIYIRCFAHFIKALSPPQHPTIEGKKHDFAIFLSMYYFGMST